MSVIIDSGGVNEVTLTNCLVTEDLAATWVPLRAIAGAGFDSALCSRDGSNGRMFNVTAVGLGFHAKYHLEQIAADSAPVKFYGHPVMYDSSGDSATTSIKVLLTGLHFEVGGASTDTAIWALSCNLVEVV